MARKTRATQQAPTFVNFDYENRTYQIDPDLKKVYRRFVEIETAKAAAIIAVWRHDIVTT
jgi:hypothetical protein